MQIMLDLNKIRSGINSWAKMDDTTNIENSIQYLKTVNDRINLERKTFIGPFWDLQCQSESPNEQLLISSIKPLVKLFIKTYLEWIKWWTPLILTRVYISKLFQISITLPEFDAEVSQSELGSFLTNLFEIGLTNSDISRSQKKEISENLDSILKSSCMKIDSSFHLLTLIDKLNLKKSISYQITDFVFSLISKWCQNVTVPSAFINSFDNQEISKEEQKLYDRFDETFHRQENIYSMIETQSKYSHLLMNVKNNQSAWLPTSACDYITKLLDLKIEAPNKDDVKMFIESKVLSVLRTCYQMFRNSLSNISPDSTKDYILYYWKISSFIDKI